MMQSMNVQHQVMPGHEQMMPQRDPQNMNMMQNYSPHMGRARMNVQQPNFPMQSMMQDVGNPYLNAQEQDMNKRQMQQNMPMNIQPQLQMQHQNQNFNISTPVNASMPSI